MLCIKSYCEILVHYCLFLVFVVFATEKSVVQEEAYNVATDQKKVMILSTEKFFFVTENALSINFHFNS